MSKVEIKTEHSGEWEETEFTDIHEAIEAVRESYKVFGIIHCQLRKITDNGIYEWDNF